MSASNFCCTHPQQRTDSPEPPARPLVSIDGIFAIAALPADHPHALKMPDKKPETDPGLVRSPGIASKIKMQFRRRSMKNLGKEKDYDQDAQRITSQEVLQEVSESVPKSEMNHEAVQQHRFGSVMDVGSTTSPTGDAGTPQLRTSVLSSLGYLRPLIEKPSDLTISDKPQNVADIAVRVATRKHLVASSSENERPLPPLPKSFSSPLLLCDDQYTPLQPRRSRSDYDLGKTLLVQKVRHSQFGSGSHSTQSKRVSELKVAHIPELHVQEPTEIVSGNGREPSSANMDTAFTSTAAQTSSENGVHLHKMDISEQLRCMSQLSDVAEDDTPIASPHPWNFHRRERSEFEASGRGRHTRQNSSTGVNSATLPSSWGRVRTPIRDTSSSIYSRPTSAGTNTMERQYTGIPDPKQMASLVDLNTLFADWPLKPSQSTEEVNRKLSVVSQKSAASEHRDKPLPPTPNDSQQQSSTMSFVTAADNADSSSIKWLSPRQRTCSIPSKDSSSTLTKATRAGRFVDRLSPPKKTVKKRRSIFKFLRPGSRKQQGRSISTPALSAKSPGGRGTYDGPSDDPALLTIQYDLTDQPSHATRSMSMSNLGQVQHSDANNQLLTPHHLQRRPTMAEYERKLSVAGDDRRRPSVISPRRIQEIHEEDRHESVTLRRRLSRAHALKDDASPLMAQALEKHQQEKALFRSASKQRESLKSAHSGSLHGSPGSAQEGSALHVSSIDEHDELLDPLSTPHAPHSSGRKVSSVGLALPQQSVASSSRRASTVGAAGAPSIKPGRAYGNQLTPQAPKPRIGTSLDSWSRYPSHTRAERSGPAGRADSVITRDFAVDINPEDIHVTDEIEPSSPVSKRSEKVRSKKHKTSLPKSRSMTFSSIVRYYSDLFHTSVGTGKNRRTSVSTGGRLDHPELEMLPPPSVEASTHHRHSHWDPYERLLEDAHKIKDFVQEEEAKIGGYVRDEEGKLEHFVQEEEDKLEGFMRKEEEIAEGFVKKEEEKFKTYVKEEEDKLLHHHRHHFGDHQSSGRNSSFQEISVLGASGDHSQEPRQRRDAMIGPTEDVENRLHAAQGDGQLDIGLALDGTQSVMTENTVKSTSKADLWSDVYKECIVETSTTEVGAVSS